MSVAKILRQGVLVFLGVAFCPAPVIKGQQVRGPSMGFVLDEMAGVRPIAGMPGAAILGAPVLSAAGFDKVVFSHQRDYLLAQTRSAGQIVLLKDLSRGSHASLLDLPPGAVRVVTSPSGDAAAFFYGESRTVKVVTGLPASPEVSWAAELPELAGGLAALAVGDGGRAVLAAGSGQGPVILATPGQGTRTLWVVGGSPSVAFFVNSLDAVVADGVLNRVVAVSDPQGEARTAELAGASQGVAAPIDVAVSSDSRRVFVANAYTPGVLVLSLTGEDPVVLACACRPTGLERLTGDGVFRLNDIGDGPLRLLDGAAPSPRVVFVPYEPSQKPAGVRPIPIRESGRGNAAPEPRSGRPIMRPERSSSDRGRP